MDAPTTKAKPTKTEQASIAAGSVAPQTPAEQQGAFATAIGEIAERFGVRVASVPQPAKNPYAMSAEKAARIAVQAGIITPAGKLKHPFK
jgi:hypothetical protein